MIFVASNPRVVRNLLSRLINGHSESIKVHRVRTGTDSKSKLTLNAKLGDPKNAPTPLDNIQRLFPWPLFSTNDLFAIKSGGDISAKRTFKIS